MTSATELILVTVHRRENISELSQIFAAINDIALRYVDGSLPDPHEPAVWQAADQYLTAPTIQVIEPLGTTDFHNMLSRSHIV
jgi:UDP-N-acetylglucosamine 2-epimerase (non-hydrolysing)